MTQSMYAFHVVELTGEFPMAYYTRIQKPLTSVTFTLHHIFYCVPRTWVVISCQRDLLLLGRLL